VTVIVRTYHALDGYGPPDHVESPWPVPRPPAPGEKVTVVLVRADRIDRPDPGYTTIDFPVTSFPVYPNRLTVHGVWVVAG
jgi:hypothetical protein